MAALSTISQVAETLPLFSVKFAFRHSARRANGDGAERAGQVNENPFTGPMTSFLILNHGGRKRQELRDGLAQQVALKLQVQEQVAMRPHSNLHQTNP
jgi:hypothetical protein